MTEMTNPNLYRKVSMGNVINPSVPFHYPTSICSGIRTVSIKGLCHGQQCLHLFSYSEAYHEQMDPIPSSNGNLDAHT